MGTIVKMRDQQAEQSRIAQFAERNGITKEELAEATVVTGDTDTMFLVMAEKAPEDSKSGEISQEKETIPKRRNRIKKEPLASFVQHPYSLRPRPRRKD